METDGGRAERLHFLEAALASVADGVVVLDATGRLVFANEAGRRIVRDLTPPEGAVEVQGSEGQLRYPDGRPVPPEETPLARALRGETVHDFEFVQADPHGTEVFVRATASPVLGDGSRVVGAVSVYRDIAEQRRTEQSLRESEVALRGVLSAMSDGVTLVGLDGRILECNDAALGMFGGTEDELVGGDVYSHIVPEDRERARSEAVIVLQKGFVRSEVRVRRKSGEVFDGEIDVSLLRDGSARPTAFVGVIRDVTERKRMEEALRESEERFRLTFDQAPIGAAIASLDYRFVRVNEQMCRITGYSSEELTSLDFPSITHPDDREEDLRLARSVATGEIALKQMEKRYIRRDGGIVWVRVSARMLKDATGQPLSYLAMFEDITERKRAEGEREQLRAAVERERATLQAVVEGMSDGLLLLDADHRVRLCNDRAGVLLGLDPAAVVGESLEAVARRVGPAFSELVGDLNSLANVRSGPRDRRVVELRGHALGRDIFAELFRVRDVEGTGPGVALLLRDVGDARRLALLEERHQIAMDLHDGLVQSLYAQTLTLSAHERTLGDQAEGTREALRLAIAQSQAMTEDIRRYIWGLRSVETSRESLRQGLEAVVGELRRGGLVRAELDYADDLEDVTDPRSVDNILRIAREATANALRHAAASVVRVRLALDRQRLVLTVGDDGKGFDPTASDSRGGQGLRNMARRAVALGGTLEVVSRPGHGTEVRLVLPAGRTEGDE